MPRLQEPSSKSTRSAWSLVRPIVHLALGRERSGVRGSARPKRLVLAVLLAVSALLIFPGLDYRYLWEDEAETALLAQNVIRFGLPIGWDGRDLISQECGIELDEHYVSRRHGWLPVYLVAASFKLLGTDTLPARLPSAVLGWLSVLSVYLLGRRVFRDDRVALLSAALLALCVPFLLYVRQSRYYALAIFTAIWALVFFLDVLEGRRFAWAGLALSLSAMFHALTPMVLGTVVALAVSFLALERRREAVGPLLRGGALALGLTLPWLAVYGLPWVPSVAPTSSNVLVAWAENVWFYLAAIDRRILPLLVPIALDGGLGIARGRRALGDPAASNRPLLLLVFAVSYLLVVAVYPGSFLRYIVNLLPVFALLTAWLATRLWKVSPRGALVVLVLMVTTDTLHGWIVPADPPFRSFAAPVRSPLLSYLGEITSDDVGPIEGIVRYLKHAARPGQRLFITYGDLPLRFYTDLEIRGGQGCQSLSGWPLPEWVIVRYFVRFRQDGAPPEHDEDRRRMLEYVHALPWHTYRRTELPVVDTIWENIPEPGHHTFRVPRHGPPVVIHWRVDGPHGGDAGNQRTAPSPGLPGERAGR